MGKRYNYGYIRILNLLTKYVRIIFLLLNYKDKQCRKSCEVIFKYSRRCSGVCCLPGNDHVVEFIKTVNDTSAVVNSRILLDDSTNRLKSAYGNNLMEQNTLNNFLDDLCTSMRVKGKPYLLPFQTGFLLSIRSLQQGMFARGIELFRGYTYIVTTRCNRDVLELYFSLIKNGCKPTN